MVRPKVSPPSPHKARQITHHMKTSCGAAPSTPKRSRVWIEANSHGAISHENTPPVSQKISHDQKRMRL